MMQIPYLTLTYGQQGGIGYPPVIIKLDQWYAVSDSRGQRYPPEILPKLWHQRSYPKRDPFYHSQSWVSRKWVSAPRLTWDEITKKLELI